MDHDRLSAKRRLKYAARDVLYRTQMFFPLRSCYETFFDRKSKSRRRQMRILYAPFISKGDIVFDVGANIGVYSEIFTELGAKVVAVEPNPRCCESLFRLAQCRLVHVEQCAAGSTSGSAGIRICELSPISTMTDRWFEISQHNPALRDARWLGELEVDMVTVDQLADRYGVPTFLKIDVEGYDDQVLRGMSFLPRALSFEYVPQGSEVAYRCLETSILKGQYEYNYVGETDTQFAWDSWLTADELRIRLRSRTSNEAFGDIFARRIA